MKSCHTRISDHQEETTSEQCLCVWKFNTDLIFVIFNVFAHVGAYGQTKVGR